MVSLFAKKYGNAALLKRSEVSTNAAWRNSYL